MIIFHKSRSRDVFDGALRFLRGMVAVVDGYVAYDGIFREIQRCWRHIINNLKAAAARASGPEAENVRLQYARLCDLYERIKGRDTASESERKAILGDVYRIAEALPEGHPSRIEILNAGDALVTFLKYKDMPPTNNPGEGVIRRGPVRHRNVRYLLRNAEGAKVLGTLISFHITCMLQGLDPVKTLAKVLRGAKLQCIFKAAPSRGDDDSSDRPEKEWKDAVARLRVAPARARGGGRGFRSAEQGQHLPLLAAAVSHSGSGGGGSLPELAAEQGCRNLPSWPRSKRILHCVHGGGGQLQEPAELAAEQKQLPVLATKKPEVKSEPQSMLQACLQPTTRHNLPNGTLLAYAILVAALVRPATIKPACGLQRSRRIVARPRHAPPRPALRTKAAARVGLKPRRPPSSQGHNNGQTPIEPPVPPPCPPGGTEDRVVRAIAQGTGGKHPGDGKFLQPVPDWGYNDL